jgi:hypothetical protein
MRYFLFSVRVLAVVIAVASAADARPSKRRSGRAQKAVASEPTAEPTPNVGETGRSATSAPNPDQERGALRALGTFAALSALVGNPASRASAQTSCRRAVDMATDLRAVTAARMSSVQVGTAGDGIGTAGVEATALDAETEHFEQFCRAVLAPETPLDLVAAAHMLDAPGFGRVTLGRALDTLRGQRDPKAAARPVPAAVRGGGHNHD